MTKYIVTITMLMFFACKSSSNPQRTDILRMLNSNNKDSIIFAIKYIEHKKDSTFMIDLFRNVYDPRISHDLRYNGMSIYQIRIIAVKNISGIAPPKKISYKPDSQIVNYYLDTLQELNLLN